MAQLGTNFAADDYQPSDRNYDALPNGWYPAKVIESDMVKKEPGVREYAKFTFEIIDGNGKGRKVWINCMNLINPSAQAQEIGRRDLADLCRAAGKASVQDTAELHDIPLMIRLGVDKDDKEKNVVKAFKAYENPTPGGQQATTQTQQQGGAASSSRPWG